MLFVTGLNHTTASVSLRERLAVRESDVAALTRDLRSQRGVEEVVLLSTCNRVEIYASGAEPQSLLPFLDRRFGLGEEMMRLYCHADQEAARHLFRVVSGLDSMVLGETEIFGQIKGAYAAAQTSGATARVLNKLFQHAFRVGKHVRSSTQIQQGATSVGGAAALQTLRGATADFARPKDHDRAIAQIAENLLGQLHCGAPDGGGTLLDLGG
jgi:glutamyl-tRNA reductase